MNDCTPLTTDVAEHWNRYWPSVCPATVMVEPHVMAPADTKLAMLLLMVLAKMSTYKGRGKEWMPLLVEGHSNGEHFMHANHVSNDKEN